MWIQSPRECFRRGFGESGGVTFLPREHGGRDLQKEREPTYAHYDDGVRDASCGEAALLYRMRA
jgi:hypothetical protein